MRFPDDGDVPQTMQFLEGWQLCFGVPDKWLVSVGLCLECQVARILLKKMLGS